MNTCIKALQENSFSKWVKTFNALFLVAGTCIGGGMLALPITSASLGFYPSILVMFIACLFMTITGLLFLEATLWMKNHIHIISLAKELLNKFGECICWIIYLFIGYASLIAYTSSGGKELSFVFTEILSIPFSNIYGSFLFVFIFGGIIYLGFGIVERVNSVMFFGMIISFIMMISVAPRNINFELLNTQNSPMSHLFFAMPLMIATFSFPGIVPSITSYLNKDVNAIRVAIIGGTTLTFLTYFIWLFLVLGTVPLEGKYGLKEAFICDIPATECLHYATQNPLFSYIAQFFAFFALTTSFLGIALALFDFLSDGFGIKKTGLGKFFLNLLIIFPTLFFAIYFQRAFITALELSGGIGDSIISGLIPTLMVWRGRYKFCKKGEYQVGGGKLLLIFTGLLSVLILAYEVTRRI